MKYPRILTGKWYLKRKWFGYVVMVELEITNICEDDFTSDPTYYRYEKAKTEDLIELGIKIG
jgi:hypothetical protein